ncbi:MAG: hypothetical protein HQL32_08300 [Planctomycetes bacterium]|nr:hypothetical protein [Planctomycetota bacterium]
MKKFHLLKLTISLILGMIAFLSAATERDASPKPDWFEYTMPFDSAAVDVSHVLEDGPAGKHGFLKTKGRKLIFEDGTPFRFWGLNVVASAVGMPKEDAVIFAQNMKKRGFNLARLHYFDSPWTGGGSKDEECLIDYSKGDSQHWNESFIDRMMFLINELKKNGIYIMMDANSGRGYLKGDGLPVKIKERARGYSMYVERVMELQQQWMKRMFNRKNPYTGLVLKEDPAFVIMNINNENDLFHTLRYNVAEPYGTELRRQLREWAKSEGRLEEVPADEVLNFHYKNSKKHRVIVDFLLYKQEQYQERMASYCRETLGMKQLLIGSNWRNGASGITLTHDSMDIMDAHLYTDVPRRSKNKRVLNDYQISAKKFFERFYQIHLLKLGNKPFISSEWDQRTGCETRAEFPYFMAAQSTLGRWAGAIQFNPIKNTQKLEYATDNASWSDPAVYGIMPHAVLLFFRDMRPAEKTVTMMIDPETVDVYEKLNTPQMFTPEIHDFVVGVGKLSGDEDPKLVIPHDGASLYGKNTTSIVSDNGMYSRNIKKGIMRINTKGTQVIAGTFGGKKYGCDNLTATIETNFATVALSALREASIEQAQELLVSVIGRCQSKGFNGVKDGDKLTFNNYGTGPMLVEPIMGKVSIKVPNPNLKVYALDATGAIQESVVSSTWEKGRLTFELSGKYKNIHYLIK